MKSEGVVIPGAAKIFSAEGPSFETLAALARQDEVSLIDRARLYTSGT
jgi:hypothetical protein